MAARKVSKIKDSHKFAALSHESPAIEQHLMQLGAHDSLKAQYDHAGNGCSNQCVLRTQFSMEEQGRRTASRASSRSQI